MLDTVCAGPGGGGEGIVEENTDPLRLADYRRRRRRPARLFHQRALDLQRGGDHRGHDGDRTAQLPRRQSADHLQLAITLSRLTTVLRHAPVDYDAA